MENKAVITNIQKYSVHDGPGIRSIIFFKGCPLNCWWCANPENISPEPQLIVNKGKCIGCGRCVDSCENKAMMVRIGVLHFYLRRMLIGF